MSGSAVLRAAVGCNASFGGGTNRGAIGEGQLQHNTPDVRFERAMHLPRRTTGVMPGFEPQVKRLVVQPSADHEYFLGIRVALAAKGGRVSPRVKPRQSSVLARDGIDAESEFLSHSLEPSDGDPTPLALGAQGIPVGRQRLRHPALQSYGHTIPLSRRTGDYADRPVTVLHPGRGSTAPVTVARSTGVGGRKRRRQSRAGLVVPHRPGSGLPSAL